ncbi:MAG: ABC transporter ATP-binding protein [Chloroflexi bacterium]|nr:MAG: ABC transporter ATP-binding protein [Chloroflexota bacterium]
MMSFPAAISVEGLRVVRGGREVIPDLDVAVARGTVTGLLGPSGCGKSTLLRSIVGVQEVAGGAVTVLGLPAGSYFASVLGAPARDPERVIEEVSLAPERDQLVSRLSGGQLSRANLAVALLGTPELLVLDEPTVGLDPVLREELWATFHRLRDERGTTLLVSSHVMDEASRCERLILMREGRILADDTPEALLQRTGASDLERAFLRLVRSGTTVRAVS